MANETHQTTLFSEPHENGYPPPAPPPEIEWRPLGDCGRWLSGGTPSKGSPEYWGGDIPWISSKSLDRFYVTDSDERVTEAGAANGTRLVPAGTILFVVRGMSLANEFRVGITQRPVTFNQDLKGLAATPDIDPLFLAYMLKAREAAVLRMADATSHGTLRLQTDLLEQLLIPIPPLPEQRAIARIPGAWDRALADLDALIVAKRRRKRGLAQRLLTGRVRLPGFGSADMTGTRIGPVPSDWHEVRLGKVFRKRSEKNAGSAIAHVITVGKYAIRPQSEHFDKSVASADLSAYNVIRPGDFVYDPMSAYYGAIGRYDYDEPGIVSPVYRVLTLRRGFDSGFVRHLLGAHYVRHRIASYSTQGNKEGKRRGLQHDAFEAIPIFVPSEEEQRQIAAVLDAADAEIGALEAQRDALARQKRGLMQRLLTGEVRVTPDPEAHQTQEPGA